LGRTGRRSDFPGVESAGEKDGQAEDYDQAEFAAAEDGSAQENPAAAEKPEQNRDEGYGIHDMMNNADAARSPWGLHPTPDGTGREQLAFAVI